MDVAQVIKRTADAVEVDIDGDVYILAPLARIRSQALEMASKLSTPGASADRVLAAAREYEAYMVGLDPPKPPNTIFSAGEQS